MSSSKNLKPPWRTAQKNHHERWMAMEEARQVRAVLLLIDKTAHAPSFCFPVVAHLRDQHGQCGVSHTDDIIPYSRPRRVSPATIPRYVSEALSPLGGQQASEQSTSRRESGLMAMSQYFSYYPREGLKSLNWLWGRSSYLLSFATK